MLRTSLAFCATMLLLATLAQAQEKKVDLNVGDPAPTFEAKDDTGATWKSADHVGKKIVVVYFYPADCTGSCTKQAQGYRDDLKTLADKGVEVVGVSGDTVENHKLFKKQQNLNFNLLADVDGKVAQAFGVPMTVGAKEVTAKIDGKDEILKRNVTTQRWTFVIGKDGKILLKNNKVAAAEDSKAILKLINGPK